MLEKIPISVLVITKNEESNIGPCLESVIKWSDEIIIIDSGSTDRTVAIAKQYTEKIYEHPFENFAQQRNWAQDNLPINNKWVLHLDADERTSDELASELKKIFSENNDNIDGIMVSRRTIFRSRWIKHGGHYPVYHLRIFKKDRGRSEQRLYDQNYIVEGKVIKVGGDLINIINPDLSVWRNRHKRWARLEAAEIVFNGNRVMNIGYTDNPIEKRNWIRYKIYYRMPLFIRSIVYFLYRYVIRRGFLDGREGLVFHLWQGLWYRWLVDWEVLKLIVSR